MTIKKFGSRKIKFKQYFDKKNLINYIGISGINAREEMTLIQNELEPLKNKNIFLGINANKKKFQKIIPLFLYPSKKGFKKIIHYSFQKTKAPEIKIREMLKIKGLEGIQLNDLDNEEKIINSIKLIPKRLEVILPLCYKNLKILENEQFMKIINMKKFHFLIDNSKGRGVKTSFKDYVKFIVLLLNKNQNKISISGGIGPKNYQIIFKLEDYFKFAFSVDAETEIKSKGKLDITKIKKYINMLK